MSREREDIIAATARAQHGVVTRRQLEQSAFPRSAVTRRLASGRLRPLYRGVYLALPFPLPRTPEMAAVLASGEGALLSHLSAAALWSLREPTKGPLDVSAEVNRGRCPGIRLHRVRRFAHDERTVREGIPVTSPGRTLIDVAPLLPTRELELVLARAEREGLFPGGAERLLRRYLGFRGVHALAAVVGPGGPALTRSAAEERLLALIREAGLPMPECNVAVGPYEVDFLWRAANFAVEVDGFRYHASRPRFEGDPRKDAELAAVGLTVVRLSWRQITEEAMATAVRLGQALARALPPEITRGR